MAKPQTPKKTDAEIRKDIQEALWNEDFQNETHLIEQYKLYVEMADRISQRRGAANTFFLTFNTAIIGALAGFFEDVPADAAVAMYVVGIILSWAWLRLLRSYGSLNGAKFMVIDELEKRLPTNMYVKAEWKALGEGKDKSRYTALSKTETAVPKAYMAVYAYLCIRAIVLLFLPG